MSEPSKYSTMESGDEQKLEQLEPRLRDLDYKPKIASYQVLNRDGTPGGWVAQFHIWHETARDLTFLPLLERPLRIRTSKEEADHVSASLGLEWLRRNVPEVGALLVSGSA